MSNLFGYIFFFWRVCVRMSIVEWEYGSEGFRWRGCSFLRWSVDFRFWNLECYIFKVEVWEEVEEEVLFEGEIKGKVNF